MSEAEHTRGPWRIGRAGSVVAEVPPEGGVRGTDDPSYYGGYLIGETITEANARLIAAAPEMLEALENLENDDCHIPSHAWVLVRDAIAKATGKEEQA